MEHYSAEAVERRLTQLKDPLVTELRTVEAAMLFHETELATLRSVRQRLVAVLGKLDPSEYGPKPKVVEKPKGQTVTPEEVAALREWLDLNIENGEGIWASMLKENPDFGAKLRSGVLVQALEALHEQSFLRLDKIGRGGSRIYKVVR